MGSARRRQKTASLIGKETDEHPTSNIERPTLNKVFYRLKKTAYACFAEVAKKSGSEFTLRIYPPEDSEVH